VNAGARFVIIGVDGLDREVVRRLGNTCEWLKKIVGESQPHLSVFPPDSVPSWTTIVTGLPPESHGQLSNNVKFFLETAAQAGASASLTPFREDCFWENSRGDDVAVVNPFLAFPAWAPKGVGAMVSGPPFDEGPPSIADPRGLLTAGKPPRMGGFSRIPGVRDLGDFVAETLALGEQQFAYALEQLASRRWDVFFYTTLVIDRLEHYAWRLFDRSDPYHEEHPAANAILDAHRQLDAFVSAAVGLMGGDDQLVILSDHGHGPRASIGVNLHEYFRRNGLYRFAEGTSSASRRMVEFAKTMVYSYAPRVGLANPAISLARRLPARKALKAGSFSGRAHSASVVVRDLAGTNPFGGMDVPESVSSDRVIELLTNLRFQGRPVCKWVRPACEVLPTGFDVRGLYPDLLFELEPEFGPTWNLYGPVFAPVLTRRRQSGGHRREGVFAGWPRVTAEPHDSLAVNELLRDLVSR